MPGPKATAIFDADDSRLQEVNRRINESLLKTQEKFAKFTELIKGAIEALALYEAAKKLAEGASESIKEGAQLDTLSQQTGVAVKDLVVLQHQFEAAGKAATDVGPAIAHMFKNIATDETASRFIAAMGINLDDLKKKSPADQFKILGGAINKLPSAIERANAAMAIFGKEGQSLLAVFGAKGFGEMDEDLASKAELMQKDAGLFHSVSTELSEAGKKTEGFFLGVADRVVPVLKPLLDGFMKLDLTKLGQQTGDFIATFAQAFTDGTLVDLIGTSLGISMLKAVNVLSGGLLAVIYGVGQLLFEAFRGAVGIFEILTSGDFWKGMSSELLGIGELFIELMLRGVAKILDGLSHIPGIGGKATRAAASVRELADDMHGRARGNAAIVQSNLLDAPVNAAKKGLVDAISNVGSAIASGFSSGSGLIDTSGMENHLDGMVDKLTTHVNTATAKALAENPTAKTGAGAMGDFLSSGLKPIVSNLQKIGGSFGGGAGGDPLLSEARSQTTILKEISAKLTPASLGRGVDAAYG